VQCPTASLDHRVKHRTDRITKLIDPNVTSIPTPGTVKNMEQCVQVSADTSDLRDAGLQNIQL